MKTILKIISYIGLGLTLIPAFFVFYGKTTLETNYVLMLIGMILWFITAPLWVKKSNG